MTKIKLQNVDVNKAKDGGETITAEELATLRAEAGKVADLEKAVEGVKTLKEQLADLEKAKEAADVLKAEHDKLKTQLADIEKAKEEAKKADMTDLVKGYSFVADEDKVLVVEALLKSADSELLITTLEKAREAINEAVTSELGSDEEAVTTDLEKSKIDAVKKALANRKS